MAVASFETLCTGLCDLAGGCILEIDVTDQGVSAFALKVDGVNVTLGHDPRRGAQHVFLMASFGPLPEGRELPACLRLLEMNCLMLTADSPSFGRDPLTGEILLQARYAFSELTPHRLYEDIAHFVSLAREWLSAAPL